MIQNKVALPADIREKSGASPTLAASPVPQIADSRNRARPAAPTLSDADRVALERWSRSRSASFRLVLRSRIVLAVCRGLSVSAAADMLATTPRTVRLWFGRFADGGIDALSRDAPGRGRRAGLSHDTVRRIVALTTHPADGRRPTARQLASVVGTSPASVCRVWAAHGIGPVSRRRDTRAGHQAPARRDDTAPRCETSGEAVRDAVLADHLLPSL